ncbi:MAG: hypothetical protein KC619_01270 [Myxococcales bacterium]|nr:hypothetical protein [Myxococcales bacterium]
MAGIPSDIVYGALLVVVSVAVVLFFRWLNAPKGVVAEVWPRDGEAFSLRAAPSDTRAYRVMVRLDIHFEGAENAQDYGLYFDLEVTVMGNEVYRGRVGIGDRIPADVYELKTAWDADEGDTDYRATIELCATGPRAAGSEIVVEGRVHTADNTAVRSLHALLAR